MPEEETNIDINATNIKRLEEIIALIITKKEEPTNRHLSFFGWDGRYELNGKKGAIFSHLDISILKAIGLKEVFWNVEYNFIDFDQLLSLYPYAECILDVLQIHLHRNDVIRNIRQIKDLSDNLKLAIQQKKEAEKETFKKVLECIK